LINLNEPLHPRADPELAKEPHVPATRGAEASRA
jgi:hypothetical protein